MHLPQSGSLPEIAAVQNARFHGTSSGFPACEKAFKRRRRCTDIGKIRYEFRNVLVESGKTSTKGKA
jgi:hypothetical protein